MASESSAVLDLNDADSEDTDNAAHPVTEDNEGAPLIMDNGYDIAVKVDAPMKQLSTLETFVTYRVRCVCARWPTPPFVRRRFNHFKVLHKRLQTSHPLLPPPPLPPPHSARQQLDRYSPLFVALRTMALHIFLDRIAKHPIFTHSEDFRLFLTLPDDELEKIFKSENSALNLWGLGNAFYSSADEAKPTNGARVKDPEFSSTAEYLNSLQHKLTTLCSLTTKLYAQSAALAHQLMNMKRVSDAWCCQSNTLSPPLRGIARAASLSAACMGANPSNGHHAALLPLLAAYAGALGDKIKQRNNIHAAHVAGNSTGELHNKLEQASEALRSELSDWVPKTHSDIKSLLLNLADKQVAKYTQSLMGWEEALKIANEKSSSVNVEELFKTVSKNAVLNLSPSKCQNLTPNETEIDVDFSSMDDDDNLMNKSDFDDKFGNAKEFDDSKDVNSDSNDVKFDSNDVKFDSNDVKFDSNDVKFDSNDVKFDSNDVKSDSCDLKADENILNAEESFLNSELNNLNSESNNLNSESNNLNSEPNNLNSNPNEGSRMSDPLQDFSEVDLSS